MNKKTANFIVFLTLATAVILTHFHPVLAEQPSQQNRDYLVEIEGIFPKQGDNIKWAYVDMTSETAVYAQVILTNGSQYLIMWHNGNVVVYELLASNNECSRAFYFFMVNGECLHKGEFLQ